VWLSSGDAFSSSFHRRLMCTEYLTSMEDSTRLGLALLSVPVAVVACGVLIGLLGRLITGRRDD